MLSRYLFNSKVFWIVLCLVFAIAFACVDDDYSEKSGILNSENITNQVS